MKSASTQAKWANVVQSLDDRSKRLFNSEYFSLYEGIIEMIDPTNGLANVRVPELNNSLFSECRIMTFCCSLHAQINIPYPVGTSVIVGFKQFNLAYPVILGQISATGQILNNFENEKVTIKIGESDVELTPTTVTLSCGTSQILITENSIQLFGNVITANGEDLTIDKVSKSSSSSSSSTNVSWYDYLGY